MIIYLLFYNYSSYIWFRHSNNQSVLLLSPKYFIKKYSLINAIWCIIIMDVIAPLGCCTPYIGTHLNPYSFHISGSLCSLYYRQWCTWIRKCAIDWYKEWMFALWLGLTSLSDLLLKHILDHTEFIILLA